MRKGYVLFITVCLCVIDLYAQDYEFTLESHYSTTSIQNHQMKARFGERLKRIEATVIDVTYGDNWTEEKRNAMEYAVKLWEEKLQTAYPKIKIKVEFFHPLNGALVKTKNVQWYNMCAEQVSYAAYSLVPAPMVKRYINDDMFLSENYYEYADEIIEKTDIVISFTDEDVFYWGTDGKTDADRYDFVTVALREIAKGLGICSNVSKRASSFWYENNKGECFAYDNFIGVSQFADQSAELAAYVQKGQIDCGYRGVTIYAPSQWVPGVSLNYFTENSSRDSTGLLLKPYMGKQESCHYIGEKVTDLLDDLGWRKPIPVGGPSSSVETSVMNSNTIDYNTGYSFASSVSRSQVDSIMGLRQIPQPKIESRSLNHPNVVNNYGWRLDILQKDGTFITTKEVIGVGESYQPFKVTPADVPDSENWTRTADGLLRARIYNKGFDGIIKYTYAFLDYLPAQPKLGIKKRVASGVFANLSLGYLLEGTSSAKLIHESEDGVYIYDVPVEKGSFTLTSVDEDIYNTFTLVAKNKNGEKVSLPVEWGGELFRARLIRELVAYESDQKLNIELKVKGDLDDNISIRNYVIAKVDNSAIRLSGTDCNDARVAVNTANLPCGVYAVRVVDETGQSYVAKFVKR